MNRTPEISVIVPVYNVEKYLERCVNSVLKQTFEDFELILVDDKSPDKSGNMCDELAQNDDRVRVVHREKNGGLSAARNSGIDVACGKYLFFLDSDDFLHRDALKTAYDNIVKTGVDVSVADTAVVGIDACDAPEPDSDDEIEILSGRDALLKKTFITTSAWGKLYKTSIFDELRFLDGYWHEDVHLSRRIFTIDGIKTVFSKKKLYCACQNPEGFSQSKYTPKKIDDALFVFEDGVTFFSEKNDRELWLMAARKHLYIAKECYFGARDDLNDKKRMQAAHDAFKRTFKAVKREELDENTYKLYSAFSRFPAFYETYEKLYWLKDGVKRKLKGK